MDIGTICILAADQNIFKLQLYNEYRLKVHTLIFNLSIHIKKKKLEERLRNLSSLIYTSPLFQGTISKWIFDSKEAQNPCCLKSSVKFPQSVMIWAAMSSAVVGPLCFMKYTVNAAIYQEILEHVMLPSADKFYGDADFIFQQDLAPAHTAKGSKSWFSDHGVTVLDWPANSPDLNPIENLWGIVKRKMRDTRPNNADDLKATVKETWASIPPHQCHKLITSMPRRIEAVIKAKGAPTKY